MWKLSKSVFLVQAHRPGDGASKDLTTYAIKATTPDLQPELSKSLHDVVAGDKCGTEATPPASGSAGGRHATPASALANPPNAFDAKTEKGSSDMYFHYYGMIMHQQNMLQVSFCGMDEFPPEWSLMSLHLTLCSGLCAVLVQHVLDDDVRVCLFLWLMQDYNRTGTYYQAIACNRPDFEGKVVMDVGAGSGILSLFAAQVRACS